MLFSISYILAFVARVRDVVELSSLVGLRDLLDRSLLQPCSCGWREDSVEAMVVEVFCFQK